MGGGRSEGGGWEVGGVRVVGGRGEGGGWYVGGVRVVSGM